MRDPLYKRINLYRNYLLVAITYRKTTPATHPLAEKERRRALALLRKLVKPALRKDATEDVLDSQKDHYQLVATLLDDLVRNDHSAEEIPPSQGTSPYIALAYRALGEVVRASI